MGATKVAEVVATSSAPADVTAMWDELRPDITLCDVHMPDIDGLELCQQLRARHPEARVLLFSARDDRTTRDAAAGAGACGLVSKTASPTELADALLAAMR